MTMTVVVAALVTGVVQPATASAQTTTFAYVVNYGSNNVSVIDTSSDTVVATVPVGNGPFRIVFTNEGAKAYVTNYGSGTVSVISTTRNQVIHTVAVGTNPWGIALSPDGTKVYVANSGSGNVSIIDTATDTVSSGFTVGDSPIGIAFSPDGTHFLVSGLSAGCPNDHCVQDYAYPSNTQIGTISGIRGQGERISFLDNTTAFVVNGCGQCGNLEKVSTTSESLVQEVGLGGFGEGLAFTPDKTSLFVGSGNPYQIQRFDPGSMAVTGSLSMGSDVNGLAFTPSGRLYATEQNLNHVVIIDPSGPTVTGGPIPVGAAPLDIQMVTVTARTTSTNVACSPSSVAVGAPTTCTATVADTDAGITGNPAGQVLFSGSSGSFSGSGACTLAADNNTNSASCSVTFTPAAGSEGSQTVTASYQGDSHFQASAGSTSLTVTTRTTSTTVGCAPNPATLNGSTTCTATVTDTDAGAAVAPSGTVSWSNGGATGSFASGTCTLGSGSGGTASCSVSYTPAAVASSSAPQVIKAAYGGDTDHATSSGTTLLAVRYVFNGFFDPVNNTPTLNTGKSGRAYPVKWQLLDAGGNYISSLSAVSSITYKPTSCSAFTNDPTDALETTANGSTGLRYDSTANQYVYSWAAPGVGCYTLFVNLNDGTTHDAYFKFTK